MNVQGRQRKPVRGRARMPDGFILPAQPTLMTTAPIGPDWQYELKHDGYRLLALKRDGEVRLWSRQITDFTEHFVHIAAAIRALPVSTALIDGEAVLFHPDGHSNFHALRGRAGGAGAVLVGFDLLSLAGYDLRSIRCKPDASSFLNWWMEDIQGSSTARRSRETG